MSKLKDTFKFFKGEWGMARITVEDGLKRGYNKFMLVHLAAKRVVQLRKGKEHLVDCANKEIVASLREIEKGMVRRFAEAIDDPNPLWQEVAPPTFPSAIMHKELLHQVFTARCPLTRILNGGSELEYYRPIKIGDVISVTGKLANLRKREGKDGKVLFMVIEISYNNQRGEVVARGRNNFTRY